jgi:hypothetical protein
VEMVLQSPLNLEPDQAAFNAQYVPPPAAGLNLNDARHDSHDDQGESQRKSRPRRSLPAWPWLMR